MARAACCHQPATALSWGLTRCVPLPFLNEGHALVTGSSGVIWCVPLCLCARSTPAPAHRNLTRAPPIFAVCRYAALAPDLGSLASADWWLQQGAYQPPLAPDWVLQEATRDVLQVSRRLLARNAVFLLPSFGGRIPT